MKGHIRINGHPYIIATSRYQQGLYNPLAAKLGSGAGKYDDLNEWSAFLMDNWQAGTNQSEAEAGGFRFSTLETRFPHRIFLPRMGLSNFYGVQPHTYNADTSLTLENSEAVACKFTAPVSETVTRAYLYLLSGDVTLSVYENTSGKPSTLIDRETIESDARPGGNWYSIDISALVTINQSYWIVVQPANNTTVELHATTLAPSGTYLTSATGTGGWSPSSTGPFFGINAATYSDSCAKIEKFNSRYYFAYGPALYRSISATGVKTLVHTFSYDITDMLAFGDTLYIATYDFDVSDTPQDLSTMDTAETVSTSTGNKAKYLQEWRGYLWRAWDNKVNYLSGSPAVWLGTDIEVAAIDDEINGMAGLGDVDMYVSADRGLYVVGAGDVVYNVNPWSGGETRNSNGRNMINWQQSVYIPVGEELYRWTGDTMLPIGPNLKEGLPSSHAGDVYTLHGTNNWLIATINNDNEQFDSIWCYDNTGWHYIGQLPRGIAITASYLDVASEEIIMGGNDGLIYVLPFSETLRKAQQDANTNVYITSGWLETPWFDGNLINVRKDIESLYMHGEGFTGGQTATLYYYADDSTEWTKLGTISRNEKELRFTGTTRPNTRRIKLGVMLQTNDYGKSPEVNALLLKFMNMVMDRWQWQLTVVCGQKQDMLDGGANDYTRRQQESNLAVAARQVAPVEFTDIDNEVYEVKVASLNRTIDRYEVVDRYQPDWDSKWYMTLIQIWDEDLAEDDPALLQED